jgi:hypothetical protein
MKKFLFSAACLSFMSLVSTDAFALTSAIGDMLTAVDMPTIKADMILVAVAAVGVGLVPIGAKVVMGFVRNFSRA